MLSSYTIIIFVKSVKCVNFVECVKNQDLQEDSYIESLNELQEKGLFI